MLEFNRTLQEYKVGFRVAHEHWLGLENVAA